MQQQPFPSQAPRNPFMGADVVYAYSRAQALEDGVLVDVNEMGRQAGFRYPTAITAGLHAELVPGEDEATLGQDYDGRLWDVLWMARNPIRCSPDGSQVSFEVILAVADGGRLEHPTYTLWAMCGPGDDGEPVITIGFPEDF